MTLLSKQAALLFVLWPVTPPAPPPPLLPYYATPCLPIPGCRGVLFETMVRDPYVETRGRQRTGCGVCGESGRYFFPVDQLSQRLCCLLSDEVRCWELVRTPVRGRSGGGGGVTETFVSRDAPYSDICEVCLGRQYDEMDKPPCAAGFFSCPTGGSVLQRRLLPQSVTGRVGVPLFLDTERALCNNCVTKLGGPAPLRGGTPKRADDSALILKLGLSQKAGILSFEQRKVIHTLIRGVEGQLGRDVHLRCIGRSAKALVQRNKGPTGMGSTIAIPHCDFVTLPDTKKQNKKKQKSEPFFFFVLKK